MKKRIAHIITSQKGESIAETLVALLISSLALVMLAGAITTTTRIVTSSQEKIKAYNEANNNLIDKDSSASTGSGDLTLKYNSTPSRTIETYEDIPYYYHDEFDGKKIVTY